MRSGTHSRPASYCSHVKDALTAVVQMTVKGNPMTTLYRHATVRTHLSSILTEGLDLACATATLPLVRLHTPERTHWALLHVVPRHGVALADVILLDVQVPRPW